MKYLFFLTVLLSYYAINAQVPVSVAGFGNEGKAAVKHIDNTLFVTWPVSKNAKGQLILNLDNDKSLFESIDLIDAGIVTNIVKKVDPVFLLTVGKRDLVSQNAWNIFFDKVPLKPFTEHKVILDKKNAEVHRIGARTIITIGKISSSSFSGNLSITLYDQSALFNVAAVISTKQDSTAIIYDAGLVSTQMAWNNISWANVYDTMKTLQPALRDTAVNEAVKYRTIIGNTTTGTIAIFPAPHQYFYPLDEAFNLKFTWHGNHYRKMVDGYGIGIRQDLYGDNRFVPWFNAPPGTEQRLNFFCLISTADAAATLGEVKKFTHNDTYPSLPGYKKMASHFHNEFVMKEILANKPVPEVPGFVKVFNAMGIDIVHLGEFHYTAHPKGPDEQRLKELKTLFDMCKHYSNDHFLLLPGEEPNEFFGGHWMALFPKPVYWIMSRKSGKLLYRKIRLMELSIALQIARKCWNY
jgi:hypothetical protein